MKNNGFTAATIVLLVLVGADTRSAGAMQIGPDSRAAARLAESPLMKAIQSTAVFRPAEKITQYEDNLNWVNETRLTNQYQAGRLVLRQEDIWDGGVLGDWQPHMRRHYTYHSDGTLSSETVFEYDSGVWRPFERTIYEGENDVFSRILVQAPRDANLWVDVQQTTYTVVDGLVVAGQTDLWLGEWTPSERFTYEETENSVIETMQMPDGDSWMNSERIIYPGLSLYYLHQEFRRLVNDFAEMEGMYFAIRLPESVSQNWTGTEWVNQFRVDTNASYEIFTGYIVNETILTDDWNGFEWVPASRTVIDYVTADDLHGLPSHTMGQLHDGTGWVDVFSEQYILQNGVRKIAQSTLSMDLGGGMEEVSRVRLTWVEMPSVGAEDPETPATFFLGQNYPNPFNPSTRIDYSLTRGQAVQLSVYDMLGRRVEVLDSGIRAVGNHSVTWDATSMPSGMYIYRLETADGVATKTLMLLK